MKFLKGKRSFGRSFEGLEGRQREKVFVKVKE